MADDHCQPKYSCVLNACRCSDYRDHCIDCSNWQRFSYCRKGWSGGGHSCGSRLGRRVRRAEAAAVPAAICAGSSAVTASSHCCCSHLHLCVCFCSCKGEHTALAVNVVADACQVVSDNAHAKPRDAPCTVIFHASCTCTDDEKQQSRVNSAHMICYPLA